MRRNFASIKNYECITLNQTCNNSKTKKTNLREKNFFNLINVTQLFKIPQKKSLRKLKQNSMNTHSE